MKIISRSYLLGAVSSLLFLSGCLGDSSDCKTHQECIKASDTYMRLGAFKLDKWPEEAQKDFKKAYDYTERFCELSPLMQDNFDGECLIKVKFYLTGLGVERDIAKAGNLLDKLEGVAKKSCEHGKGDMCFSLHTPAKAEIMNLDNEAELEKNENYQFCKQGIDLYCNRLFRARSKLTDDETVKYAHLACTKYDFIGCNKLAKHDTFLTRSDVLKAKDYHVNQCNNDNPKSCEHVFMHVQQLGKLFNIKNTLSLQRKAKEKLCLLEPDNRFCGLNKVRSYSTNEPKEKLAQSCDDGDGLACRTLLSKYQQIIKSRKTTFENGVYTKGDASFSKDEYIKTANKGCALFDYLSCEQKFLEEQSAKNKGE